MKLAYADPPYPGNAHLYAGHKDYAGEVDHAELFARLQTYDGWALSTSSKALAAVLELAPPGVRVLIWLNHQIGRSWEPVLVWPARQTRSAGRPRDWLLAEVEAFQYRPKPDGYVIGRKPPAFCDWLFRWLAAVPGEDELADLFPGSGAVSEAWRHWNAQPQLPQTTRGVDRRAGARADWLALELD